MSVQEQMPIVVYVANGNTNRFAITFDLHDQNYLVVTLNNEVAQVGAYSVLDGEVVFGTAPADGSLVTLYRDTQLNRTTNYKSYDNSFRPESVNWDFDKLWHVLQEQNLIDGKILARIKDEIEWRRTHDFNYDELAQAREKQLFDALKGYSETLLASTNPGVFQGVIAGVVFARDGKSIQTHIEEILNNLELNRSYIDEQVGLMAPQATTYNKIEVDTKIVAEIGAETTRAQAAEQVLQNQVNAVGVGNKAYLTYAEMDADKANNPVNSKLEVTNDPIDSNNGIWQWNGTTLTKSSFDPVGQAKDYTDEKTKSIELTSNTVVLYAVVSADGSVIEYTDRNGNKYLLGDDTPLQDQLITSPGFPYKTDDKLNAIAVVDEFDQSFFTIDEKGELFAGGEHQSVQYQISENKARTYLNSVACTQFEDSRITLAKAVLSANDTPFFNIKDVANYTGVSGEIQRIAAIMKVAEGRILCFWGGGVAGYDGDNSGVKLYKTFISYDKFNNITVEPKVLFREPPSIEQVSKHPMLGRLQDGRIILIWDEGHLPSTPYKQYVSYSSDNGLTWTTPVLLFDNAWVVGSTGKIITLANGRLVMPMYSSNTTFLVYSDDNGVTWLQSNILSSETYNLVEPAAELNAEGEIIVAMRSQANAKYRYYAKSTDGGQTLIDLGQNTTLPSNDCASSLAFDFENGLMFHAVPSAIFSRTAYEIRVSSDGGYNFPIKYHPFDDQEYIGYSQIIALGGNKYAVVAEGFNMLSATVNRKENLKVAIFNLNEVVHNVRTN